MTRGHNPSSSRGAGGVIVTRESSRAEEQEKQETATGRTGVKHLQELAAPHAVTVHDTMFGEELDDAWQTASPSSSLPLLPAPPPPHSLPPLLPPPPSSPSSSSVPPPPSFPSSSSLPCNDL